MEKLIRSLERGRSSDIASLWLTGAYGTGKTHASFVIKHLLEDPLEEIEDYFRKHQNIADLWPRFKALRQSSRYLVVYRSGSGHIDSAKRLLIEVQQAIKDKLRSLGYASVFGESIIDQLIEKLSDPDSIFNWEGILKKYKDRFNQVSTVDEVIECLQAGDIRLGADVAAVLEEEGVALADSPSAVKAWIREAINSNGLQGIVFIWDEFTDFFIRNLAVTPLQELAHATAEMPFYLLLITHRALKQFTRIDDDTQRKLRERFHNCQLEMTPITAYNLIANAIDVNPDRQSEWEAKRDTLWNDVDKALLEIKIMGERVQKDDLKVLSEQVQKDVFKKLVPMHPYTALLLAHISSLFSSSQRTLFQFLKSNEPGSFQWFISRYPKDNWYWLTPDYLWQYFFEEAKLEDVETISDIVAHYRSCVNSLASEAEIRVFRVVLVLTALERKTQGAHSLFRPRLEVVKRMFVGTELYRQAKDALDSLCSKNVLLAIPSGNDYEYIIPAAIVDYNKLREYIERVERTFTFEGMLDLKRSDAEFAKGLNEILSLQGSAKLRHPVQIVSAKDFKLRRERVLWCAQKPYEIGLVLVVAQQDDHFINLEEIAFEVSKDQENYCILISQIPFGSKRWRDWIEYRARAWYHDDLHDQPNKKYYETKCRNIKDEWLREVRLGRVRAFYRGKQDELSGFDAVANYLDGVVSAVYPYGPEKISKTATLYDHVWGKAGAEIGLKIARNIQQPYKNIVNQLESQGLWEGRFFSGSSEHPIAKMKRLVERFFATREHVNLKELWDALQQPPYGLMPSPIGIFLFAALLRDYAEGYYYSDGFNSLPLNPNKLAELIEQVMKETRSSERYTIRRLSPEGELFCHIARDVFHLSADQVAYPEEARKNMRKALMDLGYPLWTLVYCAQKNHASMVESIGKAVKAIDEVIVYEREELNDELMKKVVETVQPVCHGLSRMVSRERMQEGMRQFWETHAPRLISLMTSLDLNVVNVMGLLRTLLNEDAYLWREEQVRDKLPDVIRILDLTDALNCLCGVVRQDLNEARNCFRNWFRSKYPLFCYKEGQPAEIAEVIDYLYKLIYRQGQGLRDNRADDVRRLSSKLASLLSENVSLTVLLVQKFTGQKLSDQEAADIYESLPDLSEAGEEEIRQAIIKAVSQQSKQKKIADLRKRWKELTGSESPELWSEEMRTPIQWVLEGEPHYTFFDRFSNLYQHSEKDIDEMIAYLDKHAAELSALRDARKVLDCFVRVAAGEYAELVLQTGSPDRLRDYIYRSLSCKVIQWPHRLSEINRLVRQWVKKNYHADIYPQIVKVVEDLAPEEIKRFIKDLLAEDALVGARLLAAILQKKKQG
ncbi:MAG: hypothetical protein ACPLTR_03955 [Thermacetogeniaceae bacterium]